MDKLVTVLEIVPKRIVTRNCFEITYQEIGSGGRRPIQLITDADSGAPEDIVINAQEEITVPIQRIIREGNPSYFAVKPEVWEALLLMENPRTLEGVIEERDEFKEMYFMVREQRRQLLRELHIIKTASFWTRVKWLFTGVK